MMAMKSAAARGAVLGSGILMVFAGIVTVLLRVMPGPLRHVDYLVVGAIATLASMLLLFLILTTTWMKSPNTFVKRRDPDSGTRP
jgi:hypothetical protein